MDHIPNLLLIAWLAPLVSFALIVFFGPRLGKAGVFAGWVATGAIVLAGVLSLAAMFLWLGENKLPATEHHDAAAEKAHDDHAAEAKHEPKPYRQGEWYQLAPAPLFDNATGRELKISVGYYIDALTIGMFVVVTVIASCIHFYSMGYMHEELHEVVDHEVRVHGHHLHRPGRYHRFFQYMSLFCFSMLGLVISGNIAMTFVFWELVGICSYFLIGFYIERKSASNAANKAFIVNRVGDFGMIIGMMALWGSLGTFSFGDKQVKDSQGKWVPATVDGRVAEPGLFTLVRPGPDHKIVVPEGMKRSAEASTVAADPGQTHPGYWLLVVAGIGIFCGCVGKSAQFPLHVWLPDAMEGPTPVSALVHSATMVAAGVFLVGRFFPVFVPEALLVIAIIGMITLLLAATIAITAVDIKRVLAYSTVSQLGYMMLALGMGGWIAGLFHLITHAFFKSLLFLCSGSVIHACHTNDMRKMGGLRHKMPWTAYTMLVGCLAIAGAPFLSGFYSKDAIIAQGLAFKTGNPVLSFLSYAALIGASITAFYMFRLWYMTFAGKPRDHHVYEHVHEAPKVMYVPLVILAFFAITVGWQVPFTNFGVTNLLTQAVPDGTANGAGQGVLIPNLKYPSEAEAHAFHGRATLMATITALLGFLLATAMYLKHYINPEEVRRSAGKLYSLLWNKWWFDELYHAVFVQPTLFISRLAARFDRMAIDWFIDNSARATVRFSKFDDQVIDRTFVDGLANLTGSWIHSLGNYLRVVQTGKLRQYVVFIVIGTLVLFVLITFWSNLGI
jgi:NADH-quinone oxidoreductase subunit L